MAPGSGQLRAAILPQETRVGTTVIWRREPEGRTTIAASQIANFRFKAALEL